MKKVMNDPADYVDEMLEGLTLAYPHIKLLNQNGRVAVCDKPNNQRRVGIVTGGGSGHLPLFTGYVGPGLIDACSIGNVFEGPNAQSCIDAIKHADRGDGVLCLYGNYGGDRMNFDMACEMAEMDNITTRTVLGTDDIASASPEENHKRRGVAGIIFAYKVAGALADTGASLSDVAEVAQQVVDRTRTIGFALSPCQVPTAAEPTFTIANDEMEMGMGIHGEPGIWRAKMKSADDIADEMVERLLAEMPSQDNTRTALLINSLGATPMEELLILYRRVHESLRVHGIAIDFPLVGHYATSMEMAGASISLSFLTNDQMKLLRAPSESPFWKAG